MKVYCIGNGQANQLIMSQKVGALNCMSDQQKILISCIGGGETSQTLDASYYKGTGSRNGKEREVLALQENNVSVVRRLTPLECERLQALPDNWTDIGEWTDSKGKVHKESSDTPRYKAIGNGIALPFWTWLLKRVSAQYERTPTMGGLFSGIGSFELIWARINGLDSVKFTCEIEDFPNAVMRKHFDDKEES